MEGRKRKLNHPWSQHQGLALVRPPLPAVTSQTMNRQHVSLVPRIRPKPWPRHGPYYLQNNNNNGSGANQGNNSCRLANGDTGDESPIRMHLPHGNGYLSSISLPCPPPEDRVSLPQLPCCYDHPPQPPCIMRKRSNKVINNAVDIHRDTFCGDLCENFERKQFVGTDFDEFDEIQNQLKAICFAKPEILTSTLTLTALNCSKMPLTEDDLLRKYQSLEILDSHNGMHQEKQSPSRKKTNKVVANSGSKMYFPRNPLPFEKVFDISSGSNAHRQAGDTKRQKLTEVNNGNNKTNAESQTEEIASLESWLVTTTSKKIGTTLDNSQEFKIKQVESTKKRKQKKTKARVRPTPMGMGIATTLTPRPFPVNKEPNGTETVSPFAWLDEYFTTKLS